MYQNNGNAQMDKDDKNLLEHDNPKDEMLAPKNSERCIFFLNVI